MADQADDTFLDDELEENDFNFDNENEDALLAETDYDLIDNTATAEPFKEQPDNAFAEPEEDVLDIGIADEDIVDSEIVLYDNDKNEGLADIENDAMTNEVVSTTAQKSSSDRESPSDCFLRNASPNLINNDKASHTEVIHSETENFIDEEQQPDEGGTVVDVASKTKNMRNNEENAQTAIKKNEEGNEEGVSKSKIISLKKSLHKCYDDIPDLAKVIELVQQPAVINSCRNRKNVRDFISSTGLSRKKLGNSQQSKRRKDDYDSRKRMQYRRHDTHDDDVAYCDRIRDDQESDNNEDDDDEANSYRQAIDTGCRSAVVENDSRNCFQSGITTTCSDDTVWQSGVRTNQPIVASLQITQERYQITGDLHVFGAAGNAVMRGGLCSQPAFPPPSTQQPPFQPVFSYQPRRIVGGSVTRFSNMIPPSSNVPFPVDTHSNACVPFTRPLTHNICRSRQPPPQIRPLPPQLQQQQLQPLQRPLFRVPTISASSHVGEHILPVENLQQQPSPNSRMPPPLPPLNSRILAPRIMQPVNFPPPQLRQQFNVVRSSEQLQRHSVAPSPMIQRFLPSHGNGMMYSNMQQHPPSMRVPLGERMTVSAASPTAVMIRQTQHVSRMPTNVQSTFVRPQNPVTVAPPPTMPFGASNFSSPQQSSPFVTSSLRPPTMTKLSSQRIYNPNVDTSAASLSSYNSCLNDDRSTHYVVTTSSNIVSQPPPPGVVPPSNRCVSSFANVTQNSSRDIQYPYSNQNYYDTNRETRAVPLLYNTSKTFVEAPTSNVLKRTISCTVNSNSSGAGPPKQARYENINLKKVPLIRNLHEVPIVDTLPLSTFDGVTSVNDVVTYASSWTSSPTHTSTSKLEVKTSPVMDGSRSIVSSAVSKTITTATTSASSWYDDVPSHVTSQQDEDEDMKVYRRKVEYQKQLRDIYVQMKEEQRLKNQMQNFIQNNIKGILQKREQLLRKNKYEKESMRRTSSSPSPPPSSDTRNLRILNSPTIPSSQNLASSIDNRSNYKVNNSEGSSEAVATTTLNRRITAATTATTVATTGKSYLSSGIDDEKRKQGLHKVLKIKYKDGTVALKSIPVVDHGKNHILYTTDNDDTWSPHHSSSSGAHHRRTVLSKQIPVPNVNNELMDESIIVESIRKGVTQSNVTLAQRFSNLKSNNDADKRKDESPNLAKSNPNRLVIPDENESRTVWVKNIASANSAAFIQKMANTYGIVSQTRWISGTGASPNQVKITFSHSEEAKKFCLNFNRKPVDSPLITATIIPDK